MKNKREKFVQRLIEFTPKTWICLKNKYTFNLFKHDLIGGVTVGIIALPLAMAFAIASGLSPVSGLYTAIIAGFIISLLGGSYSQIGGPTGAFVVIIYNIVHNHGYTGLVLATILAGLILLAFAFFRLGTLIKYIPYPLVVGFTSGIAVIIFVSQIKDFFGLNIQNLPAEFIPKCIAIFSSFSSWHPITFGVAAGSLLLIILIRRFFPVLPWGITAIALAGGLSWILELPVETIASRFGEIPRSFPAFSLSNFLTPFDRWYNLIPEALTIAFLAGIESLLSAIVADGMTGRRHKSNCELMAVGIANIGSVLFGGIPATGAIARTATSIKSGSKTPFAGIIHSATLLLILLIFAPIVSQIPLASLSAVLVMVAWNMSEYHHFRNLFKAPPYDIAILLVTFLLTVLVDLTIAVEVGIVLSAFLFIKRIEDVSQIAPLYFLKDEPIENEEVNQESLEQSAIPNGVEVYEVTGPLFFGLADSLRDILSNIKFPPKVFILRMRQVPVIDATGMHALRELVNKCKRDHISLILSGVNKSVLHTIKKFDLLESDQEQMIFPHFDQALKRASELVQD
ncbi:MAG: sodium-independent anion transporter [Chlamydiae bacterium CG10_big_fil_rev_8_21_14_0_10_35_9]|nr:MAG: sodium-independent anion transporter [Chlamydiae bacterium CG10_big_fil_rev_8_21_14_0_10_35_9]